MVEILKKAEKKKTTCTTCKAELAYEFADIHHEHGSDIYDNPRTTCLITCPGCHKKTVVPAWNTRNNK